MSGFETVNPLIYEDPMELLDPYYGNQEPKQAESNHYPENNSDQLFTFKQEEQYQNSTFKSVRKLYFKPSPNFR